VAGTCPQSPRIHCSLVGQRGLTERYRPSGSALYRPSPPALARRSPRHISPDRFSLDSAPPGCGTFPSVSAWAGPVLTSRRQMGCAAQKQILITEKAAGAVPTNEEIKTAFWMQSSTINALLSVLLDNGILSPQDREEINRRQKELVKLLAGREEQGKGRIVRPS